MGKKPKSFADVAAKATPVRRSVRVLTRTDLLTRLADLEEQLAAARVADARAADADRQDHAPTAPAIAEQIEQLRTDAEDDMDTFVFQSLGAKGYRDLMAAHPPTPTQREQGMDHDPATFPFALVAACMVEPEGATAEQVEAWADTLNQSQWATVYNAALAVNIGEVSVPFSAAAYGVLRASRRSSQPAPDGASADPTS